MELNFTTLDVFTSTRFIGNPLSIIRVPQAFHDSVTEETKQRIATEFNLSEIVFLHEVRDGADHAVYDIFTPRSRMSFAGHPTIGTAIYVAQHPLQYPGLRKLKTIAGSVPFEYDHLTKTAEVDIPHDVYNHKAKLLPHPFPGPDTNPTNSEVVPLFSIVKGMAFNLVQLSNLETLALPTQGLIPLPLLYEQEHLDPGSGWDVGYTGTFYFVDLGIDSSDSVNQTRLLRTRSIGSREDPGTGSASAALCSYLALKEGRERGRGPFRYHLVQGVEFGRRCDIYVTVVRKGDGEGIEEVKLRGEAIEVMEGVLKVE
ncbi:phenazine biosynthesis-like protein [Dendryphion nanum]|uniref:Phenazine biosynthesis-like protein n=1 Tax=Dendryphion nanum TaxID=256645 RepID=A0A9P9DXF5_9PLEO|nr:phenazine biosynthesis-like protein [Dendryphion nanum]